MDPWAERPGGALQGREAPPTLLLPLRAVLSFRGTSCVWLLGKP